MSRKDKTNDYVGFPLSQSALYRIYNLKVGTVKPCQLKRSTTDLSMRIFSVAITGFAHRNFKSYI